MKENSSICSFVRFGRFSMWLVHVCGFALRSKCLAVRPIGSVSVRISFRTGKTILSLYDEECLHKWNTYIPTVRIWRRICMLFSNKDQINSIFHHHLPQLITWILF